MLTHVSWLMFVLLALAVARLTVLVRTDRITRAPRYFVARRVNQKGYIAYLLGCPWCISIWIGAAVAFSAHFWWHYWIFQAVVVLLALSYVASALAAGTWESDSDLPNDGEG